MTALTSLGVDVDAALDYGTFSEGQIWQKLHFCQHGPSMTIIYCQELEDVGSMYRFEKQHEKHT